MTKTIPELFVLTALGEPVPQPLLSAGDHAASVDKAIVRPLGLKTMAASIAASYGDTGAIIITSGSEGFRVGVHNMEPRELQDALCIAIYHAVSKTL